MRPGIQTFSTVRSALRNLYRESRLQMPGSMTTENEIFFRGLKREHAEEKQQGLRRMTEGKDPMPYNLYIELCRTMLSEGNIFGHIYMRLSWILMCRTDNTSKSICLA